MPATTHQNERICLIPLTNTVSGTERVVADITRKLHSRRIAVSVMLPVGETLNRLAQELRPYTDTIVRIGAVTGKESLGRNLFPALEFFRAWRPTIVHFHCPHHRWGLDVLVAAHLAGRSRLMRTEHNPLMASPDPLVGMLLRFTDRSIKTFTYVSQGNQHRFETLLPYRVGRGRLIENGIDPSRFIPAFSSEARSKLRTMMNFPIDSKIAVYVGSYGDRRSLRTIFDAFHYLLNQENAEIARRWRLLVIGAGTKEEEAIPCELGIDSFVHFAGRRTDVAQLLPHCDLFTTASSFEGMSIAILEAWAAGLPVLATQVDGIADIIGDQQWNQLMVAHGNVLAYASHWYKFMNDAPDVRAVHSQASSYVRSKFTTARMIDAYLQSYEIE
jgi:glycosyltransferase involved in cell wall biosynthesis